MVGYQRADMWTHEEKKLLEKYAGNYSAKEIGEKLGRTHYAVCRQAERLKIKLKRNGQNHGTAKLSDKQVQMVRSLAACGYRTIDILREFNLPISAEGLHGIIKGTSRKLETDGKSKQSEAYEMEINLLKAQYRQLRACKGNVDVLITKLVNHTISRINSALRSSTTASVYWCDVTREFSVYGKRKAQSDRGLIGVYGRDYNRDELKEDLRDELEPVYRNM